ncbi:hypothetical protein BLOT_015796 [Blomia tropicalis]|nr:hypothetical protein BLOT_015796 [Blomia tropicalis]
MLSNQQNPKFHRFPHTFPLKFTNIQYSYGYFHKIVLHLPIVRINAYEINGVPIYMHLTSTDTHMYDSELIENIFEFVRCTVFVLFMVIAK